MKKTIYFCTIILCMLGSFNLSAQNTGEKKRITVTANKKMNIQLEQFKCVFPYKEKNGTESRALDTATKINIVLTGNKGACTFYTMNDKGQKLITGQYKDADGVGNIKIDILDASGNLTAMEVQRVYVPVPDGQWTYYSPTGELLKKETYVKGKLVK